jgi:hypothetical protein
MRDMRSTFWMTAEEAEDEIKSRRISPQSRGTEKTGRAKRVSEPTGTKIVLSRTEKVRVELE